MKKCISASSALLATAMMVTLSFGCGEGIEGDTGSQSAELNNGQCNRIVANAIGTSQQCGNQGCSADECVELALVFEEWAASCVGDFLGGNLNGLAGSAAIQPNGDPGPIQEVICRASFSCDGDCSELQAIGLCLETDACNE